MRLGTLPSPVLACPCGASRIIAGAASAPSVSSDKGVLWRVRMTLSATRRRPARIATLLRAQPLAREAVTGAAGAAGRAVFGLREVNVVGCQRVAALAVRLSCILCDWRLTAQRVLAWRHWLQVRRIHAAAVAAQVIQFHQRINRPHEHSVRGAVGEPVAPATLVKIGHHLSVAVEAESWPVPAGIGPEFCGHVRKAFAEWYRGKSHTDILTPHTA